MKILVSACLLGLPCRYDGKSVACPELLKLKERHELIPFCPEIYGGLPTPRCPAEIREHLVITKDGSNVTQQYNKGALLAAETAKQLHCELAILKEKSPSCGTHRVYDGTFTGTLKAGMGVTARLLSENGIRCISDEDIPSEGL